MVDYRVTDDGGDRLRARARDAEDTAGTHPRLREQLRRVCTSAEAELGLDGVVISLMTELNDAPAASSGGLARALEELQLAGGEGPSREAFATRRPVLVPDLASDGRWPGFAEDAAGAGVRAVYAIPLQLGAIRFGVVTGCSTTVRTLASPEVSQLLIHAEVATDLLLDGSVPGSGGSIAELVATVGLRAEVFQAQGMVAVDLGVGLAEALVRMRAEAFLDGVDLHLLAVEIVDGSRQIPRASPDDPLRDDR